MRCCPEALGPESPNVNRVEERHRKVNGRQLTGSVLGPWNGGDSARCCRAVAKLANDRFRREQTFTAGHLNGVRWVDSCPSSGEYRVRDLRH